MATYNIIESGPGKFTGDLKMKINSPIEDILSFIHPLEDEIGLTTPDFVKLKALWFQLVSRLPLPVQLLQNSFILEEERISTESFLNSKDR